MYAPGVRVARGPDWIWQNQDGGEGHVGTVCEIGRFGSTHSPEKTVVVNWDSGHRTNYRVGYQGQYDLIIIDNAQIGVKHPNAVCNGCSINDIAGIRFRCAECSNYDLCASCYGSDLHVLDHSFIRYQTSTSIGVRVPTRKSSTKIQLKGIFVGAKVERGPDWEWGEQDGGKPGRVMEIRGWDNESCRSVANVSWVTGSTNVYRLGHKGNVDLKYIQPAAVGYYYKDHMPVLGQTEEQQPVVPAARPTYSVGDIVKVCLEREALMKLQQGHGGWNPRMAEYLTKIGTVHRITDKGDIRVQYDGCANRWTFHPSALVKVCTFHVGDIVTIINDAAKLQQLQKGHGEWVETMRNALNKTGKVIKVYADGDLRIQQTEDGFVWTLNPKCVKLERSTLAAATERSNSMMDLSHQRSDHVMMPLSGLSGTSAADKLVREAAQGKLDYVQQYLNQHADQVDVMSAGKTCLQVAAHQGHITLVGYLLSLGANVNVVDKEGDSTLHYAAFGNQPEIMRVLLQHGADINVLNASHCSALHISAHKKPPHCVQILLEYGADVNIQDSYGDTALHDAIGKENTEVVELLCNAPNLNLTVRNNRGFNALHHASLKGNLTAARRILQLARQLVDVKKDDGFSAMHLAALNGHATVVEVLYRHGKADLNIRNNRQQTPFLLAVSQGHAAAIEKLVELRCDILAKDEDGDNAMHLCVIKKSNLVQEIPQHEAPAIWEIYQSLQHITENRLMCAILCYLVKNGCSIEPNNKGKNILDWVWDKAAQELILSYVRKSPQATAAAAAATGSTSGNRQHGGTGSGGNVGETLDSLEQQQIYSNIQMLNLSDTGNGSNNSSANTSLVEQQDQQQPSSSNPPTPMRRHHLQNNREIITPSPSNPFIQYTVDDALNSIPKKQNTDRMLSPPPTSSSGHDATNTMATAIGTNEQTNSENELGVSNLSPNRTVGGVGGGGVGGSSSTSSSSKDGPKIINSHTNDDAIKVANNNSAIANSNNLPSDGNVSNTITSTTTTATTITSNNTNTTIIPNECIVCNEILLLSIFEPCGHQISCVDCAVRMKKCLSCGVLIEKRLAANGRDAVIPPIHHQSPTQLQLQQVVLAAAAAAAAEADLRQKQQQQQRQPAVDRLRYLESKILEIEETHCCSICMERRRNVAFLCGHGSCAKCAETLKTCHMCRKSIMKKINLY